MLKATKKLASQLGIGLVPLLTFDFNAGNPRVLKGRSQVANLVYSLDEMEVSVKIIKNDGKRKPPELFLCPNSGLPLRPLYFDFSEGKIMRAIPVNWREGVPYHVWRNLK